MVDVRVKRFKKRAARGSCADVLGLCVNLFDRYESMWYRGSRGDDEKMRRTTGASNARSRRLVKVMLKNYFMKRRSQLTLISGRSLIYTCAGHENIVNNREDTFTANPVTISMFNPTIVKNSGLIKFYATAVDCSGEGYLIWVKILPARFVDDLIWQIAKNVFYRIRHISDSGVLAEV